MEQMINIADLVQPKYRAGQNVWVVTRNYNGRVDNIRPMNVKQIGFTVGITNEKGVEKRAVTLQYYDNNGNPYLESQLLDTLNDLTDADRKPLVG